MPDLLDQLREQRDAARAAQDAVLTRAADEQRDLTPDELADHGRQVAAEREASDRMDAERDRQLAEVRAATTRRPGSTAAAEPVLTREQSVSNWLQTRGAFDGYRDGEPLSLQRYLRGMATAKWDGADHERALAEATIGAGGALVPAPPEPTGVRNQSGVTLTSHGAAGTAITTTTAYDWHLDAVGAVRAAGFEPNAHIQAPRTSTSLSKLREATTSAYLTPPANMLPMLVTKTVPINLTVGASTDTSLIFTAQWNQLMVGIRTDFTLRFLGERFLADTLSYSFVAYLRADIQLAQPSAFVVDLGVRG